jgi:cell division protein FtsI (penicillin-binding protein 3)
VIRLRAALIVMTMILSLFGARLFQLQGVDPNDYAAAAAATGLVTLDLPATRGQILDRNGTPLAESVDGLMIVADPSRTKDHAEEIAKILADRLHLDYFDVLATLQKATTKSGNPNHFAYIARRIPSTLATSVVAEIDKPKDAQGRPLYAGIDTRRDPLRNYPAGDVAANLLGFMGANGDLSAGGGGLEQSFNKMLAGKDGTETYEVGGNNRIPLGENTEVKPVNGQNLHLTIDRDVQWYAQRAVRTAVQHSGADSGAAIAMDTQTGEILALADYPTFDANNPGASKKDDLGARSLSDVYEPGSVEKTLTTSALINLGRVSPRTKIALPANQIGGAGLTVADRVIHDYFNHPKIHLTLAGVIALSSNIGTALAATKFKPGELPTYLHDFGLGQRSNIGIPGETAGLVPSGNWSDLTRSEVAFGQGISVNALQMITAVNAIANGGQLVTPSLIEGRATTGAGAAVGTAMTTRRQVITPETARKETSMMEMVTTQGAGTAPEAKVPGYRTAGKTGTAQEVGATCKCYDGSLDVSFAGFAPADKPRFTVYVVIKNPRSAGAGGGVTAGPPFREILSYLLQKYAVPPTETPPAALPIEW